MASLKLQNNGHLEEEWETDPNFINDLSESKSRWGSKTVEGSGHSDTYNFEMLREGAIKSHEKCKNEDMDKLPKASYGYGGVFGIETDRKDQSAEGNDYIADVPKHTSQTDYSIGFGGKFGIQHDRRDKSALDWDHVEQILKHPSQIDYAKGFGGKHGIQSESFDKSALPWGHVEKTELHPSQKDYAKGFGGKHGIQSESFDKAAYGWDHKEKLDLHSSQIVGKDKYECHVNALTPQFDAAVPALTGTTDTSNHIGLSVLDKSIDSCPTAVDVNSATKFFEAQIRSQKPRGNDCRRLGAIKSKIAKFDAVVEKHSRQAKAAAIYAPKSVNSIPSIDQIKNRFGPENRPALEELSGKTGLNSNSVLISSPLEYPTTPSISVKDRIKGFSGSSSSPSPDEPTSPPSTTLNPDTELFLKNGIHNGVVDLQTCPIDSTTNLPTQDEMGSVGEEIYTNLSEIQKLLREATLQESVVSANEIEVEGSPKMLGHEFGITAVALYDYQANEEDELSFDPGEVITNIEKVDDGWWSGTCRNKIGLFPANYVQLLNQ